MSKSKPTQSLEAALAEKFKMAVKMTKVPVRKYPCMDYCCSAQRHAEFILWVGGESIWDDPDCSVEEFACKWLYLGALNAHMQSLQCGFEVSTENECLHFEQVGGKPRWQGHISVPAGYPKYRERGVGSSKTRIYKRRDVPHDQETLYCSLSSRVGSNSIEEPSMRIMVLLETRR